MRFRLSAAGGRDPGAVLACCTFGLLALVAVVGCAAMGGPLEQPAPEYVKADRATFSAVAPTLRDYVLADPALDPALRASYLSLLGDWEFRVVTAEGAHEIPSPPRIFPPPSLGLDDDALPPPAGGSGVDENPAENMAPARGVVR